jgi:hypothetical protein
VADAYRTGLTIHAESIDVDVTLRGTAEALLLWLWGRIDIAGGELDIDGDRWSFTPTPGASPGVPGRALGGCVSGDGRGRERDRTASL